MTKDGDQNNFKKPNQNNVSGINEKHINCEALAGIDTSIIQPEVFAAQMQHWKAFA